MADTTKHSIVDLRTSCSLDEAAARLLGWMQGPFYDTAIAVQGQGEIDPDALSGLQELPQPLEVMLGDYRASAVQDLHDAAENGAEFEELARLDAIVENWDETIQRAHRFLLDMDEEIDKGEDSILKIDRHKYETTGEIYIKLHSLEKWAAAKHGQVSTQESDEDDPAIFDATAKQGGLSKTKSKSLYITLAFLVDTLAKLAAKYRIKDKPNVDAVASQISDLAAHQLIENAKFTGQGKEAITERIEDAMKMRDEHLQNLKTLRKPTK